MLLNADVPIEFGPGRHGMGEQEYLYVREPGGLRIELNTGGYRNYEPDWEPSGGPIAGVATTSTATSRCPRR